MRDRPLTIKTPWRDAILVCGKCLKRHDDGKALRRALKHEAKAQAPSEAKRDKPRIVRTACLGLCPRGALVVANAAMLSSGELMLVREANEMAEAVSRLLTPRSSAAPPRA